MENIKEFEQYFDFLKLVKGCTPVTIKDYTIWLGNFVSSMNIKSFDDIKVMTPQDIDRYMIMLTEKGNGASTRNSILSCIRSFFDFLKKRNLVEANITKDIDFAKVHKVEKIIPTKKEFCDLLEYMHKYGNQRFYTMFLFLADTGMRFSEMADLKISDLNFLGDEHFIIIRGKGCKERKIFISDELKTQLRRYILFHRAMPDVLSEDEFNAQRTKVQLKGFNNYQEYLDKREIYKDNVFTSAMGLRLDNSNFNSSLKRSAEAVGINTQVKDVSAHSLRHFFTTYALDQGVRIDVLAEMLGHSSIATTQRYIHRSDEVRLKESAKVFNFSPSEKKGE